ncbi:hypothetical protein [Microbacterium sp. 22242]|uniref:hypothetical protein n=1 Tax=Microbacterium sp. 22242 TaxID=3453896 RepID=UPI003F85A718
MSELEQPKGVSRRTVTKAMAWAVPAVALAAPVPAFATSGPAPVITPGAACKSPGNSCKSFAKGYNVPATVYNPDPVKTIYITALAITNNTLGITLTPSTYPPLPIAVAPGATVDIVLQAQSTNSANQAGSFDFVVTWGHASDGSDHDHSPIVLHISVPGTPPGCVCP